MKNWTLGAKLMAWSTLIVGLALLVFAAGTAVFLYHEQIEALDDALRNEARLILTEWHRHAQDPLSQQRELATMLLPRTEAPRFMELINTGGESVYRSPNLGPYQFADSPPGLRTANMGGNRVRLGMFEEGGVTLFLAASLEEIIGDAMEVAIAFLVALPLFLGTVLFGGWWIARKALAPVQAIAAAAEGITAEQLDRRLPEAVVRDEIGRLTSVLNAMFDRLQASFKQAMRFSADASHELKTPLTVLRTSVEHLLESRDLTAADQEAVASLLEQIQRLSSITESLLLLSRADAGRLKLDYAPADVKELISACAEDARIVAEPRGILIEADLPASLHGTVDAGRLSQIVVNLLDNAIKYNIAGGRVKITATNGSDSLRITIGNTGPAIAPEHAAHIFERFFRSEPAVEASGHGLGLSLSRELAKAHGGDLVLKSSTKGWTEFSLSVPMRFGSSTN
jgi:signal transduction histidine kinase